MSQKDDSQFFDVPFCGVDQEVYDFSESPWSNNSKQSLSVKSTDLICGPADKQADLVSTTKDKTLIPLQLFLHWSILFGVSSCFMNI